LTSFVGAAILVLVDTIPHKFGFGKCLPGVPCTLAGLRGYCSFHMLKLKDVARHYGTGVAQVSGLLRGYTWPGRQTLGRLRLAVSRAFEERNGR